MKNSLIFALICVLAFGLTGCAGKKEEQNNEALQKQDILRANIDSTIDPGVDFFNYANGGWIKQNPIPGTESRWGIANLVTEEIKIRLRKINEAAQSETGVTKGSAAQIIGDIYAAAMDTVAIERAGIGAIQYELEAIDKLKTATELTTLLGELHRMNIMPFFDMYVAQDDKNSNMMVLKISQGGLGMPGRDYYLNTDKRSQEIRNEYNSYLQKTFVLLGESPEQAGKHAATILHMETGLAKASRSLEELRDPYANYHKTALGDLSQLCPNIGWSTFFNPFGLKPGDSIIIGQPEFITAVYKCVQSTRMEDLKTYLKWNLLSGLASYLNKAVADEHFHFYNTIIYGVKQKKPRWKTIIEFENHYIGELLGQQFVKEVFPAAAKQRYENMVKTMLETYRERIKSLDWMSETTKNKALIKLNTITAKVGYPEKWRDFSKVEVSRASHVRNAINLNKWWFNFNAAKVGKPVDRTEWDMAPQEYNAYYNPSNNEIVLPAAQFAVPGYADNELDDALAYGYTAASTIGHELTHGFDDEGRQFDEKGDLKNWWTKEDEEKFNTRARLYIEQFNNYVVLDSIHVRGKATLGENIADLGGVVIGFEAFKKTRQYKKGEKIAGLTPTQRFFLGYALAWLGHQTDGKLADQILTNVHAPNNLRVNGPFSNVPEFYEAFGIKSGQPMWRPENVRVKIW